MGKTTESDKVELVNREVPVLSNNSKLFEKGELGVEQELKNAVIVLLYHHNNLLSL